MDDKSAAGTQYWDAQANNKKTTETVVNKGRAVKNLWGLKVGPYCFIIRYPEKDEEVFELGRWSRDHEPIPVTNAMLGHQLGGVRKRFEVLEHVGEGGNGTVKRCMEKQCGLMIAVTQVNFVDEKHRRVIFRPIEFMKT